MSIQIANDGLGTALKTMMRLAQPEVVTLLSKENTLILKGAGQSSSCRFRLDVTGESEGAREVTVECGLLASVIERCKDLELTFNESTLSIKAKGGYRVELATIDGQPIEVVPKDVLKGEDGIVLSSKLMAELMRYLPKIELRPLLSTYSEVPVGVKTGPKGTFVACFDFVQSAFVKLPHTSEKPIEFLLPSINQFNVLARELGSQKFRMVITETTLYAFNDVVQAALALPEQEGEQLLLSDAIGLAKALKDMTYKKLVFNTEAIKQFLSNSRAVYDKDSLFTVHAKGDKAKIELKAAMGSVKMITKLAEEVEETQFKCDLNFFSSIVNRSSSKTLELRATNELLLLKEGKINYLLSLI